MSLPEPWVDRIFAKLALVYGVEFTRKWEGLDDAELKADWARELAHMPGGSIKYALENLPPDRVPNVLQFREICRRAPYVPTTPALTHEQQKPLSSDEAAAVLRRIRERLNLPKREELK